MTDLKAPKTIPHGINKLFIFLQEVASSSEAILTWVPLQKMHFIISLLFNKTAPVEVAKASSPALDFFKTLGIRDQRKLSLVNQEKMYCTKHAEN